MLLLVPKDAAQDLAAGALGYSVYKFNAALEPLVPCLVPLDVLLDSTNNFRVRLACVDGAGVLDDVCLGDLARAVVRDWNDDTVRDVFMGENMCLEFGRGDLKPLGGHGQLKLAGLYLLKGNSKYRVFVP